MSKVVPLLETLFQNRGGSAKLWKATNEVLLQKSDEAKHFCTYMKSKLRDMNQDTQLLALDFIDYTVDDGKMPLWTQVSSKEFLSTLINLLKTRDSPEVSIKILFLIEKWGKRFEKYQEILPNFTEIYKGLKSSNVIFPENISSTYSVYLKSNEEIEEYKNERGNMSNNDNYNYAYGYNKPNDDYHYNSSNSGKVNQVQSNPSSYISYSQSIKVDLRQSSYEKKYRKLIDKLAEWINCIEVLNEKIDKAEGRVDDTIKSIATSLRQGNKQLVDTISSEKLKDEALMEISLGVAEDVNRTLKRFDVFAKGKKPEPFLSYFVENNAKNSELPTNYNVKREQVAKTNSNSNSNSNSNVFNIFDDFDVNNNQSMLQLQPQPQSQMNQNVIPKNNDTVNDLFDIFSNSVPETKSAMLPSQQQYIINTNQQNPQFDNRPNNNLYNYNYSMGNNNQSNSTNVNYDQFNPQGNTNQLYQPNVNVNVNQYANPSIIGMNPNQPLNSNIGMGYNINNQFNSQSPNFGTGINQPSIDNFNMPNYNIGDNLNSNIYANTNPNNMNNQPQYTNIYQVNTNSNNNDNDNDKALQDKMKAIDLLF